MKQNRENIQLIISLFIAGLLLTIILAVVNNFSSTSKNQSIISTPTQTTVTTNTYNSLDNEYFSYGERDLFAGETRTNDIREGIKSFNNKNYSAAIKGFQNALRTNQKPYRLNPNLHGKTYCVT